MFYTPQMAAQIKPQIQKAAPNSWRDLLGVGLGRTKDVAIAKAHEIADFREQMRQEYPQLGFESIAQEEIEAVIAVIKDDDFWPE